MTDKEYTAQTAAFLAMRTAWQRTEKTVAERIPHWQCAREAVELHRISTRLHRFAERLCNEPLLICRACDGTGSVITSVSDEWDPATPYPDEPPAQDTNCPACAGRGNTLGRRETKNEARAQEIAKAYGLRCYFQTDPRGCALYLIPNEEPAGEDSTTYSSRGVAVVHLGR